MRAPARAPAAFTLIEVTLTVILMGIVAATVMPSLLTIEDTREAAAAEEVRRLISVARGHAITTGRPCGLSVDPEADAVGLVLFNESGEEIEPLADGLGVDREPIVIPTVFRGVGIESLVDGAGVSGAGIVWFGYDGIPEVRDASGVLVSMASQDAVVEMSGGQVIIVRAISGTIE